MTFKLRQLIPAGYQCTPKSLQSRDSPKVVGEWNVVLNLGKLPISGMEDHVRVVLLLKSMLDCDN